jgi:hypothetical protein
MKSEVLKSWMYFLWRTEAFFYCISVFGFRKTSGIKPRSKYELFGTIDLFYAELSRGDLPGAGESAGR